MANNELRTKFIYDDGDNRKIDATLAKLTRANDLINSFGRNPTYGTNKLTASPQNELTAERNKAKEIASIEAQTLKNKQANAKFLESITKRRIDSEIAEERRLESIRKQAARDILQSPSGGSGAGSSGLPIGLGVAGGFGIAAIGVSKFVDVAQLAIEKAIAADRANRLLASSATEAGIAYSVLAEKNKKSGELFGLSDVAASGVTAKIQQLATFAGNSNQFDILQKRFADLGAAKGIDSRDLSTLIGTILSGQDEGLNRLGISDPGQLYKAYAKEIGKSVDALTQYEKVQAAVNAVVAKGAIFDGTAAARMNSLEGATARMNAQWENFTTRTAKAVTGNYEFVQTLKAAGDLMKSLTTDTDELQKKLSKGVLTDADITNAAKENSFLKLLGAGGNGLAAVFTGFQSNNINERFLNSAGLSDSEQVARENFLRQQLNAQKLLEANQKKDASEQKQVQRDRQLIDGINGRIDSLKSLGGTLRDVAAIEDEIYARNQSGKIAAGLGSGLGAIFGAASGGSLSDAASLAGLKKSAAERRRILIDSQKESIAALLANDPTFAQARSAQANLFNNSGFTSDKDLRELSKPLNDFVKKFTDAAKDSATELKNTLLSNGSENNPFVKLISDVAEVGTRAEKQFKALRDVSKEAGDAAVRAAVETSDAARLLNENRFGSNLTALKFGQDARRLAAQPETFFADFQRKLELVEKKVDFVAKTSELDRQISESAFYSSRYNPNNPQSFDDSRFSFADRSRFAETAGNRGRGESLQDFEKRRNEAVALGVQIQNSLEDINRLRGISLEGTGVLGESAIADRILSAIPKREDLLKQLQSPYAATRDNAQILLEEQTTALQVKRDAEQRKLQDFVANQQVLELGKKDAYEALNLLNGSSGLSREFQLKQVLGITGELGNDLDPTLRRGRFNALQESAANESRKEQEAREYNVRVEGYLQSINAALTSKGIVIEEKSRATSSVTVNAKDFDVDRRLGTSPTNSDVQSAFGDPSQYFDD